MKISVRLTICLVFLTTLFACNGETSTIGSGEVVKELEKTSSQSAENSDKSTDDSIAECPCATGNCPCNSGNHRADSGCPCVKSANNHVQGGDGPNTVGTAAVLASGDAGGKPDASTDDVDKIHNDAGSACPCAHGNCPCNGSHHHSDASFQNVNGACPHARAGDCPCLRSKAMRDSGN